ncbi:MAG TPA: thioredoxin domain-containing protein [Nitrososphaeraceae archaeon]
MKNKSRSTKINKRALTLGIILAIVIIGGSATAFLSMGQNNSNRSANTNQADELIRLLVQPVSQNASALGNDGAKITIVEFGDYQCQYCAQFHKGVRNELINKYVNTGIVKFVFKDFVINDKPFNKASTLAARASYCAADQGKYWRYHDEVYNNSMGENTGWITKSSLNEFAINVQIPDSMKFTNCLDSQKHSEVVLENDALAKSLGLKSTPTFILVADGKQPLGIIGAQPFSVFQQAVSELEKS